MLEDNLKTQLKAYLERLQRPVELVATLVPHHQPRHGQRRALCRCAPGP